MTDGGDRELDSRYYSQRLDSLQGNVDLAKEEDDLSRSLGEQEVRRHTQANDLRATFFWVACGLAIATVTTSVFLVVAAVLGAQIEPTVAVAFMSGLSVQTVGVLLVMAGYLFPKPAEV